MSTGGSGTKHGLNGRESILGRMELLRFGRPSTGDDVDGLVRPLSALTPMRCRGVIRGVAGVDLADENWLMADTGVEKGPEVVDPMDDLADELYETRLPF